MFWRVLENLNDTTERIISKSIPTRRRWCKTTISTSYSYSIDPTSTDPAPHVVALRRAYSDAPTRLWRAEDNSVAFLCPIRIMNSGIIIDYFRCEGDTAG